MANTSKGLMEVGWIQIELNIAIEAPRERVWKALVEETTLWWPKEYYATQDPKRFVIEPRVGGRMYEDLGDGAGLLWYTVIGINPPKSMNLAGHLAPPFGGPATTLLRLSLESSGKSATLLQISDSVFGHLDEKSKECIQAGWETLFEKALKPFVEGKKPN